MSELRLDLKVVRTGREYNGVSRAQILKWVAEKRLTRDDLVRPTGARNWLKISMAPELLETDEAPATGRTPPAVPPGPSYDDDDLGIEAPAKPRRRRQRIMEDAAVDMTPMIDVTFQLLIFFMLANNLANPSPIAVPEAVHGRGITPDGKQAILVDEQGRYYVGDVAQDEYIEPSLDSLVEKVATNASQAEAPLEVIVSAHKDSKHIGTRELMERLSQIENIGPIRLGVEERQ